MTEQEIDERTLHLSKTIAAEGDAGEVLHAVEKRVSRAEAKIEELKNENTTLRRRCLLCLAAILALFVVLWLLIWSLFQRKSSTTAVAPEAGTEPKKIGFNAHTPNASSLPPQN